MALIAPDVEVGGTLNTEKHAAECKAPGDLRDTCASHLRTMCRSTRKAKITSALASLWRALTWLPQRLLRVFLGTYTSRNEDVRRAGLVADINALALAAAVILLMTSRATFREAENSVKHQAWANLLQDNPGVACASLNQQPFSGSISQSIHFTCSNAHHPAPYGMRWTWAMDASNMGQVVGVLRALDECKAFSMGMHYIYTDRAVSYAGANASGSVAGVIDASTAQTLELVQHITGWERLDVITPEDTMNRVSGAGDRCARGYSNGPLARALARGTQFSPSAPSGSPGFPSDLGFPPGMEIVRWLDRSGKGIYLGVQCNSSLHFPSQELQQCINSSASLAQTMGPWSPEFWADPTPANPASFQLKGNDLGAFCPANSTLGLALFGPSLYQCSSGAQSSNVSLLTDEMNALKGIRYFAYFQCMSYDELFGVYVGTVGVLMSVALATSALYVTDVARPLLLAGREDWPWDAVQQSTGAANPEVTKRGCVRVQHVFVVILRCILGCAVGTVLGMCLIYAPWRVFLNDHGQTCNAE